MYFFAAIRLESISVRGMHLHKIFTTDTENLAFVLLDNDLMVQLSANLNTGISQKPMESAKNLWNQPKMSQKRPELSKFS